MNISKKILNAINEGVYKALSFDDDLPDTEEVTMHRIGNQLATNAYNKKLADEYIQQICQDPFDMTEDKIDKLYAAYLRSNIQYNPHFDGEDFKEFIKSIIEIKGRYADLNWIDTSDVTDMSDLFYHSTFDGYISDWDVSNVEDMHEMFEYSYFNGDLSKWDVSHVTNMEYMFANNSTFTGENGDISNWNVSSVKNMSEMFRNSKFTGDISKWDVSNVSNMPSMFLNSQFNGDISNWNVSRVTDMAHMFCYSQFTGDISKWNVSKVTWMNGMFEGSKFDGDISNWDVSNVKSMAFMFLDSWFNGDISKWGDNWGLFSLTNTVAMFENNEYFCLDLSNWNLLKLKDFGSMFHNCPGMLKKYMPKIPGNKKENLIKLCER